jgi:hypothetical protein
MSTFEALQIVGWVGNVISLIGAYRITGRNRDGYLFFAASCLFLMPPVIYGHVWNQAVLFAAYLTVDLIGYYRWGKNG